MQPYINKKRNTDSSPLHHLIVKTVLAQEYFPYNLAYLKNVATALNSQSNGLVGAVDTECRYSHAYKVVNFELLPLGILDTYFLVSIIRDCYPHGLYAFFDTRGGLLCMRKHRRNAKRRCEAQTQYHPIQLHTS